ncbi:uncharacterized protein LOC118197216 [Stegodyphus dumicola]|uniref:uncharacterized protein LOC118197216 n=1 Tax=Stegodyphus dumicola TaxID=202533 RepID=UPI0015A878B2|nr:uncharacterized protein LOC118197216 [Stegodyphus dumicola]
MSNHLNNQIQRQIQQAATPIVNTPTNSIKILQINLQKSKTATDNPIQFLTENHHDAVLVQEPYCHQGNPRNLPTTWNVFNQLNADPNNNPRAAIFVINRSWSPIIQTAKRDVVTIQITTQDSQLFLTSAYASPTEELENTLHDLNINFYNTQAPHIIGGDFNAQNQLWGYNHTSPRGSSMEDFIQANNLILHNTPEDNPTFETINSKRWPDLTLSTHHLIDKIQNRQILEDHTNSDHNYISYEIIQAIDHVHTHRFNINQGAAGNLKEPLNLKRPP